MPNKVPTLLNKTSVLTKTQLRIQAQAMMAGVELKAEMAVKLCMNLQPWLDKAQRVAIYWAHQHEMSLRPVIEYLLAQNKHVYQPIAYRHTKIMRFELVRSNELSKIFYAPEYQLHDEISYADLDLILLPLLAVDKVGCRLGKGGGYYDASLAAIGTLAQPPLLIGVGFSCQLLEDNIIAEPWDVRLDYFANEVNICSFGVR